MNRGRGGVTEPSRNDAEDGRGFGRSAAIDGWSLESARYLGAFTGYDPQDVEAGYVEEQHRRAGRASCR